MKIGSKKGKLDNYVSIFDEEMEKNKALGNSLEKSGLIFGIKFGPLMNEIAERTRNTANHITYETIVDNSNISMSSSEMKKVKKAIGDGVDVCSSVLWQISDFPFEKKITKERNEALNRKDFKKWLESVLKDDGTHYEKNTQKKYYDGINTASDSLNINIWAITDLVELENAINLFTNDDALMNPRRRSNWHNNTSSALNLYLRFFQEITKNNFMKDAFLDEKGETKNYNQLVSLIENKKNVILTGAPGVGKTFLARRLAYSIIGEENKEYVEMVQFHQNYSYEDFIMGYKPTKNHFELSTGVFYNFCETAKDNQSKKFFFIIDEINRGNISKIFGELLMLIESDKRGPNNSINLVYKDDGSDKPAEPFYVPENVYIIGLMNTADRSIALIDYALRRRFAFFELEPAFNKQIFRDYLLKKVTDSTLVDSIIEKMKALNEYIAKEDESGLGKGFCIGHSYFCSGPQNGESNKDWAKRVFNFEIIPLLEEYWWDDTTGEKVKSRKQKLLDGLD